MYSPITIQEVRNALAALEAIQRPEGDNEGDAINAPGVYDLLSLQDRLVVDSVWNTVRGYVLDSGGEVNNRNITTIRNSGYKISMGPDQYDPMHVVGQVSVGEWTLELSDPQ